MNNKYPFYQYKKLETQVKHLERELDEKENEIIACSNDNLRE